MAPNLSSVKFAIAFWLFHSASAFGAEFRFCYQDDELIRCESVSQEELTKGFSPTKEDLLFCFQDEEMIPCGNVPVLKPASKEN